MATGDQSDFLDRIKALLPSAWFPKSDGTTSNTPILDGLLSGPAWMLSWVYSLIVYASLQTRISTETDVWLDLAAKDYFGNSLFRNSGESDTAFSERIRANLLPPLGTRAAISNALESLTGKAPTIFEPWNTGDTGGYGGGEAQAYTGMAYGVAGGWGSLNLPAQAFITAYWQTTGGVAVVGGYNGQSSAPAYAPGGYGSGAIEYVTLGMAGTQVQSSQIYETVERTQAAGVTCWTRIANS